MRGAVDRARRHRAIVKLVRSQALASQDELGEALAGKGHAVTQSTLSRDLKELRILRVPVDEGYRYLPAGEEGPAAASPASRGFGAVASAEVLGVQHNEVAAVVRTQVGRAQGVAVYLDGQGLPEVLATIAGDDTILVLPKTIRKTRALARRLSELFELT